MLKVIIAAAAVVLSVEVVAISFAPGAEMTGTIPVRALKGDRLDTTRSVTPGTENTYCRLFSIIQLVRMGVVSARRGFA
jgi:hypothetical protein